MFEINDEYTKMSVHCHLGGEDADCKIDKDISFEPDFVLSESFSQIDKAYNCGYGLLAQTNSNGFDAAGWLLTRWYAACKGIELLPGVEVNLENWDNPDKILHVVLIFSPTINPLGLQLKLRNTFERQGKFSLKIEDLFDLLREKRAIICVHGIKQDGRCLRDNPEMAQELISMRRYFPVSFEDNRDFHKYILEEELKDFLSEQELDWLDNAAADLSASDRFEFDAVPSPSYLWGNQTFDDLFYCVLTGSSRIVREDDIVARPSYISRIEIDESPQMQSASFNCSQGTNCIIGSSGSGKTLLLEILKMKMKGDHLTNSASSEGNYEGIYDLSHVHLYDPAGDEIFLEDSYEVIEGENLYQRVIRAYRDDKEGLKRELGLTVDDHPFYKLMSKFEREMNEYLRNKRRAAKSKEMAEKALTQAQSAAKFLDANSTVRPEIIGFSCDPAVRSRLEALNSNLDVFAEDAKKIKDAFATLLNIARKYDFVDKVSAGLVAVNKVFEKRLGAIEARMKKEIKELKYKQALQAFIFSTSQTYNGTISTQSQQVNEKKQVLSTKLEELAMQLIESCMIQCKLTAPHLEKDQIRTSISMKSANENSSLSIAAVDLNISREKLAEVFQSQVGVRKSREKIGMGVFDNSYDFSSSDDVKAMLDRFIDNDLSGELSMSICPETLIEYSIELKDEGGVLRPIEDFSAGMLSKMYVTQFFDSAISDAGSNTIVLYDQPESNMEKAFLNEILAPKFKELRKSHQIFIATHEPLLVINADANEIILAVNEKRVDHPNSIRYENRSFVGAHGHSELIEDVANLIDGGSDAVKHRSEVYEGMKAND